MSHAGNFYPSSLTATSMTLTVGFRVRENKGAGSWAASSLIPTLAVVFPNGASDGKPWNAIKETLVQHILNSDIPMWWSPPGGQTVEAALRVALDDLPLQKTTATVYVFFDGQAGSVYCG